MGLVIGLLTLLLVLVSLLLILLILVQLPKKEAGAGLAFGGGASDALFGAGSGTVLSRITKYGVGVFLAISMVLSVLYTHQAKAARQSVLGELDRQARATAVTPATPTNVVAPLMPVVAPTGGVPALLVTNLPPSLTTSTATPPPEPGR